MAILRMLAMEKGEPGFTPLPEQENYVPFSRGGNGFQGGVSRLFYPTSGDSGFRVSIPAGRIFIEFTSNRDWGIGFIGALHAQFGLYYDSVAGTLTTLQLSTSANAGQNLIVNTLLVTPGEHRWGVEYYGHKTSGECKVFLDGVLVDTRSGNTLNAVNYFDQTPNRVQFSGPHCDPGFSARRTFNFDSVVISDDGFLGDCHVDYLVPNGPGASTEWVPSDPLKDNYELVNEIPVSASSYVEADSDGLTDLYNLSNLPSGGQILAVQGVAHTWKTGAGLEYPTDLVFKSGANELSTPIAGIGPTMGGFATPLFMTNPQGGDWTASEINALQAGVRTNA